MLACPVNVNGTPQRKASLELRYLILIKLHGIDVPASGCIILYVWPEDNG